MPSRTTDAPKNDKNKTKPQRLKQIYIPKQNISTNVYELEAREFIIKHTNTSNKIVLPG